MATQANVLNRPSLVLLRNLVVWLVVLLSGICILSGRYNWSPETREGAYYAYISSIYLFVIFLPAIYYSLTYFVPWPRLVLTITIIAAIFMIMPYHWLGLENHYYYANHPLSYSIADAPTSTNWFPDAFYGRSAIPHEKLIFGGLLLLGIGIAVVYYWRVAQLSRSLLRPILFWLGIYSLILLETWLHLSLRSPYVYLTHYEQPPENAYWYIVYLFSGGKGAVNADFATFRSLENYFSGDVPVNLMLIRRSATAYFSSQFSYFINTFYVYLFMNISFWFTAAVCGYLFLRRIWNEHIAQFMALLIASGTGFIMYVGQPMSYLAGFAMIIILIYLFDNLIVSGDTYGQMILFGLLLGIGLMTYDVVAVIIFLVGYGLICETKIHRIFTPIAIGVAISLGFVYLENTILGVGIDASNIREATLPFTNILQMIKSPHFDEWYLAASSFFNLYGGHLAKAFFTVPLIPAAIGLFLLHERKQAIIILLLLLPAFLVLAYMHFGKTYLETNPRFLYACYPGIYMLIAITLYKMSSVQGTRLKQTVGFYAAWSCMLLLLILSNIDVFGYPVLYYHFYHAEGYAWPVSQGQ